MEKCVVIYKSLTGFTEKYANWIAEDLGCDAYPLENVNLVDLSVFDLIIYGGGVRAGKMGGIKFVDKIRHEFPNKNLVIFATGATPSRETEAIERFKSMNVPKNSGIPFFYFQSGFNYERMKGFDKVIMNLVKGIMSRVKDKDGTTDEMVLAMRNSYDYSSKESTEPLVSYVRTL